MRKQTPGCSRTSPSERVSLWFGLRCKTLCLDLNFINISPECLSSTQQPHSAAVPSQPPEPLTAGHLAL